MTTTRNCARARVVVIAHNQPHAKLARPPLRRAMRSGRPFFPHYATRLRSTNSAGLMVMRRMPPGFELGSVPSEIQSATCDLEIGGLNAARHAAGRQPTKAGGVDSLVWDTLAIRKIPHALDPVFNRRRALLKAISPVEPAATPVAACAPLAPTAATCATS